MSLKAVELQIALPKTFDAGKVAEQHQQNTINQQLHANEQLKREIERKQFTVNDAEEMNAITEEEERNGQQQQYIMEQKGKKEQQEKSKVQHPFKGNFVDFSG